MNLLLPYSLLTSIYLTVLVPYGNTFSKNEAVSQNRIQNEVHVNLHPETAHNSIKAPCNINSKPFANKSIKKYTEKEILDLLIGNYIPDEGCCSCTFELRFEKKNKKLKYRIKTNKRKINGIAKITIDENGYVFILFPIEWDDYQGDMTLDTYEPYTGIKPQEVDMYFDPELKNIAFQNYGNAMNNYIIFDECDTKGISLNKI